MNQQEADRLIAKYLDNTAGPEERALIENWYIKEANTRKLSDDDNFDHLAGELWAGTQRRAGLSVQPKVNRLWPRIAVAASILFILSFGAFLFLKYYSTEQQPAENLALENTPAIYHPILVLGSGKKIILNNSQKGLLAEQGVSTISRSANGVISYHQAAGDIAGNATSIYNTLVIPGGTNNQQLVLPDGTKVWINAASSLRYPTAFTKNERQVELNGEAYFEVAHNPLKPFRVVSKGQTVEVLGTHFDINAYDDEPAVKTTLLEGRVKVTAAANHAIRYLAPGQQAALDPDSFTVVPSDTEEAIAWKNGRFVFQNDHIQHIMRVIARWYNMKIEYKGKIPENSFGGTILRDKSVSENLNILQLTGKVRFHIKGRLIIVSK
ncbi:DUF4974 domain-containing protein [Mucilaginibacter sp. BJC16-A38]|uniref:FecR family protein n=1 Tax=Mucilaginibacter phenanthrenivorans TaxID=1234842 RepID=UPI002157E12C|nr:FecR family protein [Mucilaginibacter phenanthrenivorans]MCR8557328.1 DUF4974 domain-containing protein [Mucilaginibacter phenanthrenivorans]